MVSLPYRTAYELSLQLFVTLTGQNMHTEEVARFAVLSAVRYHREKKSGNGDVSRWRLREMFLVVLRVMKNKNLLLSPRG